MNLISENSFTTYLHKIYDCYKPISIPYQIQFLQQTHYWYNLILKHIH